MKPPILSTVGGILLAILLLQIDLTAGTFKRITIDGLFADWAGVPVAYTDEQDSQGLFDFRTIQVANDESFLYLRITLHEPANYDNFHHHIFVDRDNDPGTGMSTLGVGSEMMIEDGGGWQQKNGGFNEGAASGLEWQAAPSGMLTQFEVRVSRGAVDFEQQPVFTQDVIALALEVRNSSWVLKDAMGEPIPYEFAPKPGLFTGTQTLVGLTNTSWRFNATGTELGTNWLSSDYDDQQGGWQDGQGLFGFGAPPGLYPAPVQSTLASSHTTYYFRSKFSWNHDAAGVGLIASNYLSDGAVVYLNGEEVKRLRLPEGPINAEVPAKGGPANPGQVEWYSVPAGGLILGENILAVEVHQANSTPSELVFGLSLTASDSLPPIIEDATQPSDRNVVEGDPTTLEVGRISGSPPFSFQWVKDGAPIEGATNATLILPSVLVSDAGRYVLEIINEHGKTASREAVLSTTALPVSLTDSGLPADRSVLERGNATFTVQVAGSPPLAYQWFKDGVAIAGAQEPELTITNAMLSDGGKYWVTISNRLNSVTSRQATLLVQRDTIPASIVSVSGSARTVRVQFSEPVDAASAALADNYALNTGLQVVSATPDDTDKSVVILTTSQQTFGTPYILTVNGVQDLFGNPAKSSRAFRSTIFIDGRFDDWAGIEPIQSEPQDTPEGLEFKDFYLANDDDYLYLRFSFHAPVGPLPVNHFYHINLDADANAETGFSSGGAGIEVMIENNNGYQQKNGEFNEGAVQNLDLLLAPQEQTNEFEARLSRKAIYETDSQPVFVSPSIRVVYSLINTGWTALDLAPQGGVPYEFVTHPPLPETEISLQIRRMGSQVEISWTGDATLEWSATMPSSSWTPLTNTASPYMADPSGSARYYRLKK